MAIYYIDPEGRTENHGTSESSPWHIGVLYDAFEQGRFGPGDQILFKRGVIHPITSGQGWIHTRNCTGTAEEPLILGGYGEADHRPILQMACESQTPIIGMWSSGKDCDYVHVIGLELCDWRDTAAISVKGVTGWELRDLYLHGGRWVEYIGIAMHVKDNSKGVLVSGCIVQDVEGEGLYVGATGTEDRTEITVRDCVFRRCLNEGVDFKGGVSNSLIENCTFEDNAPGERGDYAQVNLGGLDNIMRGCTVRGTAGSNRYGLNFFYTHSCAAARRTLVEDCRFENCPTALRFNGDDNLVRGCTVEDNATAILARSSWCNSDPTQEVREYTFKGSMEYDVRFEEDAAQNPIRLFAFDYNSYGDAETPWYWDGQARTLQYVQEMLDQELHASTPEPGTIPQPDRGKPRIQYERIYVLLPQDAGSEWAHAAVDATHGNRNTIGYSADDAAIGDLDIRRIIAVNPHQIGTGLTQEWYDEHYPDVIFMSVLAATPEELAEKLRALTWPGHA
jgi:hypothetical protein